MAGNNARVNLGFLAVLFVGLLGLAALSQSFGQADASASHPKVAAFFTEKDKLQVAVFVDNQGPKPAKGSMQVHLVNGAGAKVSSHEREVASAGQQLFDFDFPAIKARDDKATLQVVFQGKSFEVKLAKALLAKAHETTVGGGVDFAVGGSGAYVIGVHGVLASGEAMALPGADVTLKLRGQDGKTHDLYEGKTDIQGRANPRFAVPMVEPGQYTLEIQTASAWGKEMLERAVNIKSDVKVLLITDRPIYQPGHLIHLRALALRPDDMKPVAGKDLQFEVEDPKGNKVFKRTLKTSDYGIASVDFQLADEVNMGDYHLRAFLGNERADKTVTVKRYVLPKFKVDVTSDKAFYLPKEKVKLEIQSDYFFGKPVAGSKIEVTASTFDVQFRQFYKAPAQTDAKGHAKLEIQLPDYFVGQPLQKGNAIVKIDVQVTDTADHAETVVKSYTVSEQPIQVSLIPESGKLAPGMENRIFVATITPDGRPAQAKVNLWLGKKADGQPLVTLETNDVGLGEFRITPKNEQFRDAGQGPRDVEFLGGRQQSFGTNHVLDIYAEAKDAQGNQATSVAEMSSQPFGENILLRLDKAIYQTGDRLQMDIRTSAGMPTVFIDVVRGGQIMMSRWLPVKDGHAQQSIDLPPNVFGSLEIHAYQMLRHGEIIRDSRIAYVQPKNDLKIEVKAEKSEYAPGEEARIRFLVTDSAGKPAAAALGVIMVDEAVYALQDLQPGLEKVYFTLQEELLKPKVQVKIDDTVNNLVLQRALPPKRQQIARVLLTGVKLPPPQRWLVDPAADRQQRVENQVSQIAFVIWNNSVNVKADVFEKTKDGKLAFKKDLLADMVKANQLTPDLFNSPFGEKWTLEELVRMELSMTPDNLARAITLQRMYQVYIAVINYANQHRDQYLKNDRWVLDQKIIAAALNNQNRGVTVAEDAWGQAIRLVAYDTPRTGAFNQVHFKYYDLLSAGPDRKFGTKDDLKIDDLPKFQQQGNGRFWFLDEQAYERTALNTMRFRLGGYWRHRWPWRFRRRRPRRWFRRRRWWNGKSRVPAPMAARANLLQEDASAGRGRTDGAAQAPSVKVREFFPETMLWQPSIITDDKGIADLAVNFADSITTWRLSASANSLGGSLGGVNFPLKVFQDFFVDIDLPLNLTQRDEVAFPVAVYNYLKTPQTVKLVLEQEPWFELIDAGGLTRTLELQPNEVTSVKFRIRAGKIGFQSLTVKAYGSKKNDAVKRSVEVVPNGERFEKIVSDRLQGKAVQTIDIPDAALADASKISVRLYPGVLAQVMDGMEGMMRMPGGCFEQTSSSAYPNILVIDYIKKTKMASPQLLLKAEEYLNVGYQRLLTFERPGGGFDWWGRDEPLVWLSAYGLQEFSDMARVYPIDRNIIARTQNFLMKNMDKDGTWSKIGATHSETIANMGDPKLLLTSYVAWSLLESGVPKDKLKTSIEYIRSHLNDSLDNAYILALAANALAAYDAKDDSTLSLIQRLEKQRKDLPEWKAVNYPTKRQSLTYARGDCVNVETTALTVLAMVKTGQFTNSVNQSLTYLVKSKGNGSWGSTSATILSLKALLAGMGGPKITDRVNFSVLVDGNKIGKGEITEEGADMYRAFSVNVTPGKHQVEIDIDGETGLMYQIVGRHFEPWKPKTKLPKLQKGFDVDVAYDRTQLKANDMLHAKATLKYKGDLPANMVMLDLGIPPGFTVEPGDFAEMVGKKQVNKFSITSRQVILYLSDLRPGEVKTFDYTLRAKYPLKARTPATTAYEYYTPDNRALAAPVELVVVDNK